MLTLSPLFLFLLNRVSIYFLVNIPPLFHESQLPVLRGALMIHGYVNQTSYAQFGFAFEVWISFSLEGVFKFILFFACYPVCCF